MNERERQILDRLKGIAVQRLSRNRGGDDKSSSKALDDGLHDGEVCLARYLLETFFLSEEISE